MCHTTASRTMQQCQAHSPNSPTAAPNLRTQIGYHNESSLCGTPPRVHDSTRATSVRPRGHSPTKPTCTRHIACNTNASRESAMNPHSQWQQLEALAHTPNSAKVSNCQVGQHCQQHVAGNLCQPIPVQHIHPRPRPSRRHRARGTPQRVSLAHGHGGTHRRRPSTHVSGGLCWTAGDPDMNPGRTVPYGFAEPGENRMPGARAACTTRLGAPGAPDSAALGAPAPATPLVATPPPPPASAPPPLPTPGTGTLPAPVLADGALAPASSGASEDGAPAPGPCAPLDAWCSIRTTWLQEKR